MVFTLNYTRIHSLLCSKNVRTDDEEKRRTEQITFQTKPITARSISRCGKVNGYHNTPYLPPKPKMNLYNKRVQQQTSLEHFTPENQSVFFNYKVEFTYWQTSVEDALVQLAGKYSLKHAICLLMISYREHGERLALRTVHYHSIYNRTISLNIGLLHYRKHILKYEFIVTSNTCSFGAQRQPPASPGCG